VLTAGAAGLGLAVAGCAPKAEPAPAATLPPDTSARQTAAPVPTTLAGTGAAYFFGKPFVPDLRDHFGIDRAKIYPSSDPRFKHFLRVTLPGGLKDNPNSPAIYGDKLTFGGTQLFLNSGYPRNELYLRYYVRFGNDFDFNKGGLLPGFYGSIVKGTQRSESDRDGFATRFMWRKKGAGGVYTNTSALYNSSIKPVNVRAKDRWNWKPGQWICVEQGVRMNSVGFAQGLLLIYIDGVEVYKEHGYNLRLSSKLRIGGVLFQAAYGTGDRSFAQDYDQTIDFAAFAVGQSRVGIIKPPKS
jgi:hypothetical protein